MKRGEGFDKPTFGGIIPSMQTFLPYPNFLETAAVLDDARLRKQQLEAEQILNVLRNPNPKGWANHPAVLQWKGYEYALELYIYCISEECKKRGFKGRHDSYPAMLVFPLWMDNKKIHESHKSRLLFKGRVDAAGETLKRGGIKKVNEWLVANGYPKKNVFKIDDIVRLERYLLSHDLDLVDNHYRQYWPDLDDTIPYVWPVTKGTIKQ